MKLSSLSQIFLILSLCFYVSIISFLTGFLGTGSAGGDFEAAAAGNPINQLVGVILLLASIYFIFKHENMSVFSFVRVGYPWVLLIGFFLVALTWTEVPMTSFRRIVAFSTLVITTYVLAQMFEPTSLLRCLYQVVVASIVMGLIWTVIQGNTISIGLGDRAAGFRGIFTDKNAAARVYAYGFILAIGLKQYKTKLQIVQLSLVLLALLASQSASAIVLSIIGTVLILVFRASKSDNRERNFFRFVVTILLIVTASYLIMLMYEMLLEMLGRDPTLTNRAIIWELITPLIEEKFYLGYGFGAFWASSAVSGFIERWGFIGNAHSGYFEVMLHGGIACFILFIYFMFILVKRIFWTFINQPKESLNELILSIIVVQLVGNYVGYIIFNHNSFDMLIFSLCFFISANLYMNKGSN